MRGEQHDAERGHGENPGDDARELKARGVAEVFTPGAPTSEIVDFIRGKVAA